MVECRCRNLSKISPVRTYSFINVYTYDFKTLDRFRWAWIGVQKCKASSTLCRINLKTQLWERKRNKCSAPTLKRFRWLFTFKISNIIFFAMLIIWKDKLHDKMTSAYSKSCGYKMFSVHTNTKKYRFQIVPLWRAFSKSSVFVDLFMSISVDGSRIRNNNCCVFKFIRHSVDGA